MNRYVTDGWLTGGVPVGVTNLGVGDFNFRGAMQTCSLILKLKSKWLSLDFIFIQ